jgi:hypothetical protein
MAPQISAAGTPLSTSSMLSKFCCELTNPSTDPKMSEEGYENYQKHTFKIAIRDSKAFEKSH